LLKLHKCAEITEISVTFSPVILLTPFYLSSSLPLLLLFLSLQDLDPAARGTGPPPVIDYEEVPVEVNAE
jgi:hypothetical protein